MTPLGCTLDGHPLSLEAYDGKLLRLVSATPFAPGQPMRVEVALAPPLTLELKSIGSVRRPDGAYDVRARTVTLRREARAALLAHFASSDAGAACPPETSAPPSTQPKAPAR